MSDQRGAGHALSAVSHSAALLSGAAVVAQILGIVRELYLAAKEGISGDLDALLIAMVLPVTLANVFVNGTTTALVPAYVEAKRDGGAKSARVLAGSIGTWVALAGAALLVLLVVLADGAIRVAGPGLSDEAHTDAVGYLLLLAPLALVTALSGILGAVCQSEESFAPLAVANVISPACTIVAMVVLWDGLGLASFAVGSLIGPVAAMMVLLLGAYRVGAMPIPGLAVSPLGRSLLRHAAPLTLSSAIGLLTAIGDRAIATLLFPGAVSALRYGEVLIKVPVSLIGPAWSSAIYPALVRAAQGLGRSDLGTTTSLAVRYAIALFVPIAGLCAAVAPVAVGVAYGRGAFSEDDLVVTSQVVAASAPLVVILMTAPVLTSSLNARKRGRAVLAGGSMNVLINLILDVVFGLTLGVVGISLAGTISSLFVTVFFSRRIATDERSFPISDIWTVLQRACLASIPGTLIWGAVCWSMPAPTDMFSGVVILAVAGVTGVAFYAWLASLLRLNEVRVLSRRIVDQARRAIGSPHQV